MASLLFYVLVLLGTVVPLWRICARAGFNPALSVLVVFPFVGIIIIAALLSFREWPQQSAASKEQEPWRL